MDSILHKINYFVKGYCVLLQHMCCSASVLAALWGNPSAWAEENVFLIYDEKCPVFTHVWCFVQRQITDAITTMSICHLYHVKETLDRLQCRLRDQNWSEWRTCTGSGAVHQSATFDTSFLCLLATDFFFALHSNAPEYLHSHLTQNVITGYYWISAAWCLIMIEIIAHNKLSWSLNKHAFKGREALCYHCQKCGYLPVSAHLSTHYETMNWPEET